MPRFAALNRYWSDHPPVHILLAAFMGVKPKASRTQSNDPSELAALMGLLRPE